MFQNNFKIREYNHNHEMSEQVFKSKYLHNGRIVPNNVKCISGDLDLSNLGMKKIENLPEHIQGDLNLAFNKIEKIENLPDVQYCLFLDHNKISKIENLPKFMNLNLSNNYISKLENLPDINGYFLIDDNNISKIENIPRIMGVISLINNSITKIENLPDRIWDVLNLDGNDIDEVIISPTISMDLIRFNGITYTKNEILEKMRSMNKKRNVNKWDKI